MHKSLRIQQLQVEAGWTDDTLLDLALKFISENGKMIDFENQLDDLVNEELDTPNSGILDSEGYLDHALCVEKSLHLTSCDDNGYCNYCGVQESEGEYEPEWSCPLPCL